MEWNIVENEGPSPEAHSYANNARCKNRRIVATLCLARGGIYYKILTVKNIKKSKTSVSLLAMN